MVEFVILNGDVIDGSGSKRYKADVAVDEGKITAIGDLQNVSAKHVLDAAGKVVTPGFIDMHSHADLTLPACPTADNLVQQGITTVVTGQCGMGLAPLLPETRDLLISFLGSESVPLTWEWDSFGSFLDHLLKTGISVNMSPLVAHGIIRGGVLGLKQTPATVEEMEAMHKVLIRCLQEGAAGISTGLIYIPGISTGTEELINFTRPVGQNGGLYFSHIRDEGDKLFEALEEAITIGKQSETGVHISHFKAAGSENYWKAEPALEMIDRARLEGLDITADMYPYVSGNTALFALLPSWVTEGNKAAALERLSSPILREKIAQEMKSSGFFRIMEWDKVMIPKAPAKPEYVGRCISDLASEAKKSPYEWVFDALIETGFDIEMLVFLISEENLLRQIKVDDMMIGTDGVAYAPGGLRSSGLPHPRCFGTFPRVLKEFVREKKVIGLEEAIWRMCGLPAQVLKLKKRGKIETGFAADLVVFDPETINDMGTYQAPEQYPVGIDFVMVNGKIVVNKGNHTGIRAGKIVNRL